MKRTRRTAPGTLAPGDAYAPSMFPDEHPSPPAPLALFDDAAGRLDIDRAALPPVAPCAVCTATDHVTGACPHGIAPRIFHEYQPGTDAAYMGS